MTGSISITSPVEACVPRDCNTTAPHDLCLNGGICVDTLDTGVNCSCSSNFFGEGCQFFDRCSQGPCQNGGQCYVDISNINQFTCICPEGFNGTTCENRTPSCLALPCSNGATCEDGEDGSFECLCPTGFTGTLCETDIDDCASQPCENGGSCTDGVGDFDCSCLPEFSGPTCGVPVILCRVDTCLNGGTCIEEENDVQCSCAPGFTGDRCSESFSLCEDTSPCQNGGTCFDTTPGNFECVCPLGFTAATCETPVNFCFNDSCSSNGVCVSLTNRSECQCDPGFTGERCEVDIDDCTSAPCLNGGTCMDGIGMFMCICELGFTGTNCDVDIDECLLRSCENGGTCVDEVNGISCLCPAGFSGSLCDIQTDFCINRTCFNGGTCNSVGNTAVCSCSAGWSGDQCQFPDNVVVKLASCNLTMARDMLAEVGLVESNEPFSFRSGGSSAATFSYDLQGSQGLYYSGWIWQERGTSSVLFSFRDRSGSSVAQLVSDLVESELRFSFSSGAADEVSRAVFTDAPLREKAWMHIALAVFNNNSIAVNVDGRFSQMGRLEALNASSEEAIFEVPSAVQVNIARGVSELSSVDSAQGFSGLMRGVAISSIAASTDSFDLSSLQNCTLNCVGGESSCSNGGQCLDLFGPERRCTCAYGLGGLSCQEPHTRFSFDGSSFAQLVPPLMAPLNDLQFSFKTDVSIGELSMITSPSAQTSLQLLDSDTLQVNISYCDGTSFSQDFTGMMNFDDLQYHTAVISDSVELDGVNLGAFSLLSPSCNDTFMSSTVLGSHNTDNPSGNFNGCLRDISHDDIPLNPRDLRLSTGAQFGCTRDTAQFHLFSHLELPQFVSRQSQVISLSFSTFAQRGLLYFSGRVPEDATGGMPIDFIALHIENGQAIFTFNLGEQDQNLVLQSSTLVNDGNWHTLTAVQNGTMASLYVDGALVEDQSMGPLVLLDTTGNVFVGGVPAEGRIASFNAYTGLDGCVRDLEQNGVAVDMQDYLSISFVRFGICN